MLTPKYLPSILLLFCCSVIQPSLAGNGIRVVYSYGNEQVFKEVLQEFGASIGITVKAEFIVQNDLKNSLMAMVDKRNTPDAIIMPADHVGLNEYLQYSEVNNTLLSANISKRMWESGSIDGKFYGAPLIQGNHLMLYYNKGLIKEPATDWSTMFAQQAELTAKGITTIGWPYSEPYWFLAFLSAYGGWPVTNGKIELNTPAMVSALDFYKDLRIKQLLDPDCKKDCAPNLFKAEKIAYIITGDWEGVGFAKVLGDKLGVSALPNIQEKKMLSPFTTHVIAFPRHGLAGKKRANLIRLANYLQSPKIQQKLWLQTGAIPVETSTFLYAQKNATGYLKQTLTLMEAAKPLPTEQAMSFIWEAIHKGYKRHREGALNSQQAALYMQKTAEQYINNAKAEAKNTTKKPLEN